MCVSSQFRDYTVRVSRCVTSQPSRRESATSHALSFTCPAYRCLPRPAITINIRHQTNTQREENKPTHCVYCPRVSGAHTLPLSLARIHRRRRRRRRLLRAASDSASSQPCRARSACIKASGHIITIIPTTIRPPIDIPTTPSPPASTKRRRRRRHRRLH